MINVEGYKAFHGVMKITPKGMIVPEFKLEADWLYIPDKKVWIANNVEYSEEICTVVRDDAEKLIPKKPIVKDDTAFDGSLIDVVIVCPVCNRKICSEPADDIMASFLKEEYPHCHCGLKLDWSGLK